MDHWRPVAKGMIKIWEDEEEAGGGRPNADVPGMTRSQAHAAGQEAALRMFECAWVHGGGEADDDDDA